MSYDKKITGNQGRSVAAVAAGWPDGRGRSGTGVTGRAQGMMLQARYRLLSMRALSLSRRTRFARHTLYDRFGKRVLDVTLCLVSLPVSLPLTAILWCLVRLEGGPGLFSQQRVGRGGKHFACYKLRTMVANAEEELQRILEADPVLRAEWERDQKFRNDPRITRLGRFLRKTSLDELPQIWNVLRGDMGLVGARPVVPDELERYGDFAHYYKSQRPGLTGAWQVSGRNHITYEDRVALDVAYVRGLSFREDIRIILRTFREVLLRSGF